MSSFMEEIVISNSSFDFKTESFASKNHDKLETRIQNEMNSIDILIVDDGAKTLNSNIDNWMLFLKKNILNEFDGMKMSLKNISKNIIINEVKRFENEMSQLKNCNVEYQSEINKLKTDISSYKSNIKNLSNKLSKNKNKFLEGKYMFNWRLKKEQLDRQRFCEKISIKFHQTSIMRKAFYSWKHSLEMTWKNRNNSKIERQAQSVCKQLITEYERQIISLRSEITKLQDENTIIQTSRSATQDAVKKALMRGVCALNMETMSILNQSDILTEGDRESNNNCFMNSFSHVKGKKSFPLNDNSKFNDDQPRFPLNRSISDCNDNTFHYLKADSCINEMDDININDIEIKQITDIPNFHGKGENNQNSLNYSTQRFTNNGKLKNNYHSDTYSRQKSGSCKNSAIIVQAGNPTGSHTHCSNSSLNISVQRHVNDTVLSQYSGIRFQSDNIENRFYKK